MASVTALLPHQHDEFPGHSEVWTGVNGTGPERGLALIFTLAGLIGLLVTALAQGSRSYRRLVAVTPAG